MRLAAVGLVALLLAAGGLVASRAAPTDAAAAAPTTVAASELVAQAASAFLRTLGAAEKELATYPLDHEERFNWHFVPRERNGLPLKAMTLEQRAAAHALLRATMSDQGYLKVNAVVELERVLGIIEGRPERRDPEQYFVTIYGDPSGPEPWAWRFEGHHLSLSFTSATGELTVTGPAFFGANPATVPSGQKAGWRVLGEEEATARTVLAMLTPDQRRTAVLTAEAPRDIITGNERQVTLAYEGLQASRMTAEQRRALSEVVWAYVGNMEDQAGKNWMERLAGLQGEQIYFAWAGSDVPGEGHYYRVHTPLFLIEYDNTQGNANHVHSVWRDLENDFGGDLLRRHYQESDHHR